MNKYFETSYQRCFLIALSLCIVSCALHQPFRITDKQDLEGLKLLNIKPVFQRSRGTCGLACLATVLDHWGHPVSIKTLQDIVKEENQRSITPEVLKSLSERYGLVAFVYEGTLEDIIEQIDKGRPVITLKNTFPQGKHYEVVCGYNSVKRIIICHNPNKGLYYFSYKKMRKRLTKTNNFILLVCIKKK